MHPLAKTFYKLFDGRRDTWAVQRVGSDGEASYFRVTGKELTLENFSSHLLGEEVIGIYPLKRGGLCRFAAVDVDTPDEKVARYVQEALPQPNYLERSRSGNHHVWMFFGKDIQVTALEKLCRETIACVKRKVGCHCSLYPLPTTGDLGVLIALPCQGDAVASGKSAFLNEEGVPIPMKQLGFFLKEIKHTKLHLEEGLSVKKLYLGEGKKRGDRSRSGYDFSLAQALLAKGLPTELAREALLNKPEGTIHSTSEEYLERTLVKAERVETRAVPTRSWNDIVPVTREEYFMKLSEKLVIGTEQKQQLDIFFATLVANLKTTGRPIWLLIVGPPGCGKTLPMIAVQHSPFTYACSSFRPAALISGWGLKGGQDMSMIPKLYNKVLLVKDMSSLLSQHSEVVNEIMGLLRDAYDGFCSRAFGTGVERSYKSRFGFIGAATPDIDTHWSLNTRLGERFLRLRVGSTLDQVYGKIDLSLANIRDEDHIDATIEEVSLGYLKYLTREEASLPPLMMQKEIGRLAQLGAILRTSVARHAYSRQVLVIPEWEEATRYAKQLAKVAIALAFLREKGGNDDEEFQDLKTLIRSGMDAKTEKLCAAIYRNPGATTHKLSVVMGIPSGMVRMWLEDLNIARIILGERDSYEMRWSFVPLLAGMIKKFQLW